MTIIGKTISKICNSIIYLLITAKLKKTFEEVTRKLDILCTKQLVLDCVTR